MTKIELNLNELLGMDYDEDGDPIGRRDLKAEIVGRAAELIVAEHRKEARDEVSERIGVVIDSEITTIVREVLAQPIQQRRSWGDKVGEPTSVLEIARTKLEGFFASPSGRRDSYDRSAKNLADLIEDTVKSAVAEEFRPAIAEARKTVAARMEQALSSIVAANVTKFR
jgi:hypothetical protein